MQPNLFRPAASQRKEPRDYQVAASESIFSYFSEMDGSPLVVIPTGGGKSLVISEFIEQATERFPGTKVMVLSHVALLLSQDAETLLSQCPGTDISFYSDSLGQKDLSGDVIFAGIQSIYKRAYDLRHTVDLILLDEAHLLGPDDNSMYRKFLDDMWAINNNIKIVGFTASPFRAGYGMLHKGKNALFTDICYEIGIAELISRGHLCPIVTPQMNTQVDTSGVKMRGGDYIQSQLSKAVDDSALTKACVDEIVTHGADRNKWLVFTVDIAHCEHMCTEIKSRGIDCEMVHSKMDGSDCARVIDRFKNGSARCLVNVAMLTTGADFPAVDLLAMCRPTKSPVLYLQCAGRGLRPFPKKENCLFLDFGGIISELGPIDQIRVAEKGEGDGEAPTKICPGEFPSGEKCGATLYAATMKCPHCHYVFPDPGLNLDGKPSDAAVLSSQLKPKIHEVSSVSYYRHKKEGKPDTLRVDYLCGFSVYREWICFEHRGYAREKACNWWRERGDPKIIGRAPNTIDEALRWSAELAVPSHIHVKKIGKYHEIMHYDFSGKAAQ